MGGKYVRLKLDRQRRYDEWFNRSRPATGPERIELLLPWINGEPLSEALVRERIFFFLEPSAGVQARGVEHRGFTRTAAPWVNDEIFGRDRRRKLNLKK